MQRRRPAPPGGRSRRPGQLGALPPRFLPVFSAVGRDAQYGRVHHGRVCPRDEATRSTVRHGVFENSLTEFHTTFTSHISYCCIHVDLTCSVFAESFRNEPPLERLRQILRFENDSVREPLPQLVFYFTCAHARSLLESPLSAPNRLQDWTSFCELNFASSTQARGAAAPAISDMLVSAHHASPAATAAADRKPKSSSAVKSKKRKANP